MIGRAAAAAGATLGAVAPAVGVVIDKGARVTESVPTVWHLGGYAFEAGSMIAALCACVAVRFYVVLRDTAAHRWTLDIPVSALALMFTAGLVVKLRPDPLGALLLGTGLGILGAGIIAIAKKYLDQVLGPLVGPPDKT